MGYPVTLNGRTYTLADFEGQNYVSGFPDALEDFVTDAGTQVTAAAASATAAASSATAAAASATSAQASLDAIEGLYLGAQSSNPTVDLNGDPLTAGDWYFNTSSNSAVVYDGSAWNTITSYELSTDTTPQLGGTLDANGNTIDMGTNVITDAKVGQWDTAYGWGDHSTAGYLTSYTETDTLDSVTGRGATTTNAVTVGNLTSTGIDDNATSTAITIDSSQNVGIGQTAPDSSASYSTLHIGDNAAAPQNARLILEGSTNKFGLYAFNDYFGIYDYTGGANRLTINSSGDVGIGDGAISATLDVHSTTASSEISVEGSGGKWATLLSGTGAIGPALCFDNTSSRFRISSSADKLGSGQTEHFIVEPSGDVGIGVVPGATRLEVRGSTTNSTAYSIYCSNSAGTQLFFARNDGLIGTGATTNSPYNLTTGSSANLHVASSGLLYRSTSSLKYKTNIQSLPYGLADVMNLKPITFESKDDDSGRTFAGFIAEDIHDAGLSEFVEYNDAEEPDALAYGNMVSLLTKAIQEQQAMIEELQSQVQALISG